jgi:hypothetical protein
MSNDHSRIQQNDELDQSIEDAMFALVPEGGVFIVVHGKIGGEGVKIISNIEDGQLVKKLLEAGARGIGEVLSSDKN